MQREASIEDQVRVCRRRIEQEGWELDRHLQRRRGSPAPAGFGPATRSCWRMPGPTPLTLLSPRRSTGSPATRRTSPPCTSSSRFRGVRIVTLAEGEISELHVGLKGTMNALFLKDLAAKTHRGLEGRVREGRRAAGICFGYDVVREHDARGDPIHGGRQINAAEAEIVRRIFREFTAGKAPRAIARDLNADRIAGPRGRPWSDTTIRGHTLRGTGILHNELYIGRLVWNRQRYLKDPQTGRRLARLNPAIAWLVTEVPELRILDDALWQQAQARLGSIRQSPRVAKARAAEFWKHRRAQHLLTGLAHCGVCGSPLAASGKDYLTCAGGPPAGDLQQQAEHAPSRPRGRDPRRAEGPADGSGAGQGVHRRVPSGSEPPQP